MVRPDAGGDRDPPDQPQTPASLGSGAAEGGGDHLIRGWRGLKLYRDGSTSEATAEWRQAIEFDPKNWIIRKQLWAVEHPDKFYDEDVDYGWQREQIDKGL